MAGGDFKRINKRVKKLNEEINRIKKLPMGFIPNGKVFDDDNRKGVKWTRENARKIVEECDDCIRESISIRNDINNHINELQQSKNGGKLENYLEKCDELEKTEQRLSEMKMGYKDLL